ncbi:unnamed protein product, partial [Rotaria sp. Silwood2]
MAVIHENYDSNDNSPKNMDIENFFPDAVQDIDQKLKTIGEEYKIGTLVEQENLKQDSTNEDKNEATLSFNEQQQ